MPEKDPDIQKIKELIKIMKDNELVNIEIQHGEDRIALERPHPQPPIATAGHILTPVPGLIAPGALPQAQAGAATSKSAAAAAEGTVEVKSPIVGTFYEAPSPDSDAYVEIGSHVDPQTVVCIIEAMKVMNEIKAEVSGTIKEKLVRNGQAVEYGQPLFRVKPE